MNPDRKPQRDYYKRNQEKCRKRASEYYYKNREKILFKAKLERVYASEERGKRPKKPLEKIIEERRAKAREYYAKHAERMRDRKKYEYYLQREAILYKRKMRRIYGTAWGEKVQYGIY